MYDIYPLMLFETCTEMKPINPTIIILILIIIIIIIDNDKKKGKKKWEFRRTWSFSEVMMIPIVTG